MKRSFKKIIRSSLGASLVAAMLFCGVASSYPAVVSGVNDSSVQSLENEIAQLQAEQDRIMGEINSIKGEKSKAAERKQKMDSLATATRQKITLAEALSKELTDKITQSEEKITEYEASIEVTRQKIIDRLRYAQENGNVNELELLLDSKGMSDFLTRLDKVNSMMEYDRRIISDFKEQMASLKAYRETLEDSKKSQEEVIVSLKKDQSTYESVSKENEAYMNSLQSDESAYWAEYNKAKKAEDALNAELTAYINQQQAQNTVVPSGDGFIRPLPAGVGYISSHFGYRNLNGSQDYHGATDIACPHGTQIFASNSGKVIRAEYHYSYGNYVLIDHGGGISTLYAHCSGLAVYAGQTVNRGQVIGYVGNTGYSFGAHLHFEYRINGERVNPANYVPL